MSFKEDELIELMEKYYRGDKLIDLKTEYRFNLTASELVKLFPPDVHDSSCDYCKENYISYKKVRNQSWRDNTFIFCPNCQHSPESINCMCDYCIEKREILKEQEIAKKKQFVRNKVNYNQALDIDELTLIEKIYLGTLIREGFIENENYIRPLDTFSSPFAPTKIYSTEIIESLLKQGVILLHEDNLEFFNLIDEEQEKYSFNPFKVSWKVNVLNIEEEETINSLLYPNIDLKEEIDDLIKFWKEIAINECIEYLQHNISNVFKMDFISGDITKSSFNSLLENYSVSQIYALIYSATTNALRFYTEKNITKKHAMNTVVSNTRNYGERSLSENRIIAKYTRIKNLPQSALSKFYFNAVLKISDKGFNEPPKVKFII